MAAPPAPGALRRPRGRLNIGGSFRRESSILELFLAFAVVGFGAQLIDGALGMGFGVISSSILLASGVAPPLISATVNAAKIPTGFVASLSHWRFGNIDWRIARRLALFGCVGGVGGALFLSHSNTPVVVGVVSVFLILIGALILWRGVTGQAPQPLALAPTPVIGATGGLIEGIGGSWGPVVTTGLLGAGHPPRQSVGSSAAGELVVSAAVFLTLTLTHLLGHWGQGEGEAAMIAPLLGLVAGGLPAAVFGGWLAAHVPRRPLTVGVGLLAISIGAWRLWGLVA